MPSRSKSRLLTPGEEFVLKSPPSGEGPLNYVDYTLVRLADPGLRSGLFDQDSLEQILATAYEVEAMTLDGPYAPVFDEFFLGISIPRRATIDGVWGPITTPERHEGRFQLFNLGGNV